MKKLFCLLTLITLLTALSACGRPAEWTRLGNFEDENHNQLYVTYSSPDERTELYVGGMIDGRVFGNVVSQEGGVLLGDLAKEDEEGGFVVTLAEEGEDGLILTVEGGGTYHFRPWQAQQPAITVHIDTEGQGQIAYADADTGLAPEFDAEYPCTFAQLGLAGRSTFIFAAQADPGWRFVKWTKDGEDFSTEESVTVKLTEDADFTAVFTPEEGEGQNTVQDFAGEYQAGRAHAVVETEGENEARVTIEWGDSASSLVRWVMSGEFDAAGLTVDYDDCVKTYVTYNDGGGLAGEETLYENGSGRFSFSPDGTGFTWHEDQSDRGEDVEFERLPVQ